MEYPNPGVRIPSLGVQGRFSGAQIAIDALTITKHSVTNRLPMFTAPKYLNAYLQGLVLFSLASPGTECSTARDVENWRLQDTLGRLRGHSSVIVIRHDF
jgi:hypothetical protein